MFVSYVLSDASSLRPASDSDMVDQLFFLFNDMLLWTTPAFDITGSVELSKLTCLPNQLPSMPLTISLGVRGQPFSADMVFLAKDREEYEQWLRYLDAAIRTATELQANPGVRIVQANRSSGGPLGTPSPMPLSVSPPAAPHPLDGPSSALNYAAQHQPPQHQHANSHELEL